MTEAAPIPEITGKLDDYGLMTEGKHAGRYAARIDGKPYPVLQHVDHFLLRLQKGIRVDALIKIVNDEEWINKIQKSKTPEPAKKEPTKEEIAKDQAEYNARAAAIEEQARKNRDHLDEVEKRNKAGFGEPTEVSAPQGKEMVCTSPNPVTGPPTFSNDQINLIKATVARGCTQTEFELLMYLSAQYGLDPIRRQIWAVKYGTAPASIFTGRDGFLEIAHRSGQFDGMESGVKTVREGDQDELIGWCKVYRKDMSHPFYVEVYEREYTTGKSFWQTKPRIMIQKVAESSCLRRAFSVSGLYCPEEMPEQGSA